MSGLLNLFRRREPSSSSSFTVEPSVPRPSFGLGATTLNTNIVPAGVIVKLEKTALTFSPDVNKWIERVTTLLQNPLSTSSSSSSTISEAIHDAPEGTPTNVLALLKIIVDVEALKLKKRDVQVCFTVIMDVSGSMGESVKIFMTAFLEYVENNLDKFARVDLVCFDQDINFKNFQKLDLSYPDDKPWVTKEDAWKRFQRNASVMSAGGGTHLSKAITYIAETVIPKVISASQTPTSTSASTNPFEHLKALKTAFPQHGGVVDTIISLHQGGSSDAASTVINAQVSTFKDTLLRTLASDLSNAVDTTTETVWSVLAMTDGENDRYDSTRMDGEVARWTYLLTNHPHIKVVYTKLPYSQCLLQDLNKLVNAAHFVGPTINVPSIVLPSSNDPRYRGNSAAHQAAVEAAYAPLRQAVQVNVVAAAGLASANPTLTFNRAAVQSGLLSFNQTPLDISGQTHSIVLDDNGHPQEILIPVNIPTIHGQQHESVNLHLDLTISSSSSSSTDLLPGKRIGIPSKGSGADSVTLKLSQQVEFTPTVATPYDELRKLVDLSAEMESWVTAGFAAGPGRTNLRQIAEEGRRRLGVAQELEKVITLAQSAANASGKEKLSGSRSNRDKVIKDAAERSALLKAQITRFRQLITEANQVLLDLIENGSLVDTSKIKDNNVLKRYESFLHFALTRKANVTLLQQKRKKVASLKNELKAGERERLNAERAAKLAMESKSLTDDETAALLDHVRTSDLAPYLPLFQKLVEDQRKGIPTAIGFLVQQTYVNPAAASAVHTTKNVLTSTPKLVLLSQLVGGSIVASSITTPSAAEENDDEDGFEFVADDEGENDGKDAFEVVSHNEEHKSTTTSSSVRSVRSFTKGVKWEVMMLTGGSKFALIPLAIGGGWDLRLTTDHHPTILSILGGTPSSFASRWLLGPIHIAKLVDQWMESGDQHPEMLPPLLRAVVKETKRIVYGKDKMGEAVYPHGDHPDSLTAAREVVLTFFKGDFLPKTTPSLWVILGHLLALPEKERMSALRLAFHHHHQHQPSSSDVMDWAHHFVRREALRLALLHIYDKAVSSTNVQHVASVFAKLEDVITNGLYRGSISISPSDLVGSDSKDASEIFTNLIKATPQQTGKYPNLAPSESWRVVERKGTDADASDLLRTLLPNIEVGLGIKAANALKTLITSDGSESVRSTTTTTTSSSSEDIFTLQPEAVAHSTASRLLKALENLVIGDAVFCSPKSVDAVFAFLRVIDSTHGTPYTTSPSKDILVNFEKDGGSFSESYLQEILSRSEQQRKLIPSIIFGEYKFRALSVWLLQYSRNNDLIQKLDDETIKSWVPMTVLTKGGSNMEVYTRYILAAAAERASTREVARIEALQKAEGWEADVAKLRGAKTLLEFAALLFRTDALQINDRNHHIKRNHISFSKLVKAIKGFPTDHNKGVVGRHLYDHARENLDLLALAKLCVLVYGYVPVSRTPIRDLLADMTENGSPLFSKVELDNIFSSVIPVCVGNGPSGGTLWTMGHRHSNFIQMALRRDPLLASFSKLEQVPGFHVPDVELPPQQQRCHQERQKESSPVDPIDMSVEELQVLLERKKSEKKAELLAQLAALQV